MDTAPRPDRPSCTVCGAPRVRARGGVWVCAGQRQSSPEGRWVGGDCDGYHRRLGIPTV